MAVYHHYSLQGRKDFAAGNEAAGEKKMRTALMCNLVAIIAGAFALIFINILLPAILGGVIPVIIRAAHGKS